MNKDYDQYFTTNKILLKGFAKELLKIKEDINDFKILEPSIGNCDLIVNLLEESLYKNITAFEIDEQLKEYNDKFKLNIIYEDFLKYNFKDNKYDLIIMNPPFTYTAEFINKCYELLNDNGYMICLCQNNTLKLTKNIQLLNKLNENGLFISLRKYTDEHLFKNASIGVIIFTYQKHINKDNKQLTNKKNSCRYYTNNKQKQIKQYIINPIFQFVETEQIQIKDLFDVYVGYVSGADNILKINKDYGNENKNNTIEILKKENEIELYYDITNENDAKDIKQIINNKTKLINRKIKKFDNNNWFEFGLKRNESIIKENYGKKCLYVYNQTRNKNICFESVVQYFGGNLLMLLPKYQNIDLNEIKNILNNNEFKQQYITDNNRFKTTHKQLSTSYINYKYDKNDYPKIINDLKIYIEENIKDINFINMVKDGRVNSSIQEDLITNILNNKCFDEYKIFIPNSRWWFDFALVKDKYDFIPFNIKITTMNANDNFAGYSSIAFALSNMKMKYNKNYANNIIDKITFEESKRDYWFLVINKDTKEIIINSVKGINKITPNQLNLPFQIKWMDNKIYNPKSVNETVDLISSQTHNYINKIPLISKHIRLFENE